MSRDSKIIIAVVAGSALLVGGTVIAGALWFVLETRARDPIDAIAYAEEYGDYDEEDGDYGDDYVDSMGEELSAAEKRLGANHPDLAPMLVSLAEMQLMEGDADDVVPLLERAVRIMEAEHGSNSPMLLDALELLADAHTMRQDHKGSIAVRERLLRHAEGEGHATDTAVALVQLATAHVRGGHDDRAQPLVSRARRLFARCEARGNCFGDELLAELTQLDFARVELALDRGSPAAANRLMRDIAARAVRDGGDPCGALVDTVFARVEDLVMRCERLAHAGKIDEADRLYDNVFRILALTETAGDCTELVDPYLVSDLTLVLLRTDLKAGRYPKARGRIDRLTGYARTHFDRGELREMVRYDITDVVLELASNAAAEDRLDDAHRLQRFILQLYASMGLTDTPTMCEVVLAMSDSDLTALEEHLMAKEVDKAEALVEQLRARYDDYRVRRCAPEMFHELALTLGEHAIDAADRRQHIDARRLIAIAQGLCKKSGPECQRELREIERDLREPR